MRLALPIHALANLRGMSRIKRRVQEETLGKGVTIVALLAGWPARSDRPGAAGADLFEQQRPGPGTFCQVRAFGVNLPGWSFSTASERDTPLEKHARACSLRIKE
jgi:hypothetical protein